MIGCDYSILNCKALILTLSPPYLENLIGW